MASERKISRKEVEFSWTDDKLQLFLQGALDYKAKCEFNTENWEPNANIRKIFLIF